MLPIFLRLVPFSIQQSCVLLMHISTHKVAFSPEEIFNHLKLKDPELYRRINEVICTYAEELYENYPGARLSSSPVSTGMQIKQCGVPIFFEISGEDECRIALNQVNSSCERTRISC